MKRMTKPTPHPQRESNKSTATGQWGEQNTSIQKKIDVRTLLKGNQQSKKQPGNSSTTCREELQSRAQSYNKNFQDLVEEVNTKRRLGYKIFEYSDRLNKMEVPYQQTVHLLEKYPSNRYVETKFHLTQQVSLKNIWKRQGSARQVWTIIGLHIYAKIPSRQRMQSKATQFKQ